MIKEKIRPDKDIASEIKSLYNQALDEIDKIKKNRNEKIKDLMQKMDKKIADKILRDIKNLD